MSQNFAALIYHGAISGEAPPMAFGSYGETLLRSAEHPKCDTRFLRYMLGEMLKCIFYPDRLDPILYRDFLDRLGHTRPIHPVKLDILAVYTNDFYPLTIAAYVIFDLPIEVPYTCEEWPEQHQNHTSIADAIQFYWTFPWDSNLNTFGKISLDTLNESALCRMPVERISFMPACC